MTYSTLKICSGRSAFEAVPQPRLRLDLGRVRESIERWGVSVTDARVMLIARTDPELTVSSDGRVLIKTSDERIAAALFERLKPILEGGPGSPVRA